MSPYEMIMSSVNSGLAQNNVCNILVLEKLEFFVKNIQDVSSPKSRKINKKRQTTPIKQVQEQDSHSRKRQKIITNGGKKTKNKNKKLINKKTKKKYKSKSKILYKKKNTNKRITKKKKQTKK